MSIEEKKELCSKALMMWFIEEDKGKDMREHNPEVADMFISKVLLKKFEVFEIDIVLPDMLLLILDLCVEGNPGQVQIVLKDLLESIVKRNGKIPKGYIIKSEDVGFAFPMDFPILAIPELNKKYEQKWDAQKSGGRNLCDTPEWWLEVME